MFVDFHLLSVPAVVFCMLFFCRLQMPFCVAALFSHPKNFPSQPPPPQNKCVIKNLWEFFSGNFCWKIFLLEMSVCCRGDCSRQIWSFSLGSCKGAGGFVPQTCHAPDPTLTCQADRASFWYCFFTWLWVLGAALSSGLGLGLTAVFRFRK